MPWTPPEKDVEVQEWKPPAGDTPVQANAKPWTPPAGDVPDEEPPSLDPIDILGRTMDRMKRGVSAVVDPVLKTAGKAVDTVEDIVPNAYNALSQMTGGRFPGVNGRMEPWSKTIPATVKDFSTGVARDVLTRNNPIAPLVQPQIEGVSKGLGEAAGSFATGEGIASAGLLAVPGGQAAMLAKMGLDAPEQIEQAVKVWNDPKSSREDKWKAATGSAVNLAMAAGLALHMKPETVRAKYDPNQVVDLLGKEPKPPIEVPKTVENAPGHIDEIPALQPGAETADVPANVPLGLNRSDVVDPRLRKLSDEEFDAAHVKARDNVDRLEKAMDEGQPLDRQEMANAQDEWNAADNERFRRSNTDVSPPDLFRKLLDEPNPTKQLLLMEELERQKAPLDEMLSDTKFNHPDDEEIFKGKLEQLRDTLSKQSTAKKGAPQALGASMGAVTPSDPAEPVGKGNAGNPDIYGVAERVRNERAKAGQVNHVEPGEGISPPDSVDRGRELLKTGSDPEKALSDFEKTKRLSSDDMALVRAKGEELAASARRIEEKFGTHSPEYKLAFDALSSWDKRTKAMQTEWAKTGHSQQGETDIDTGTFTGMQRAFKDSTGKDFTPKQAKTAKTIAEASSKADLEAAEAKRKLYEEVNREPRVDPKVKSIADRIVSVLDKTANDALARIKARRGRLTVGLDPVDLADHAIYGASKIAKGTIEFSKWSAEMVKDLGDYVKPHLKDIWDAADKHLDDQIAKATNGTTRDAVKQVVKKTATTRTLEQIKEVMADHKPGTPFTTDQVKALWERAKVYLDQGVDDFDEIRNKLATDLGLFVKDVTSGLTQKRSTKRLADDVWKKQQQARRVQGQAKRWLANAEMPTLEKAIRQIPNVLFRAKVGFHGTVALGTHAPMVAFKPQFWKSYVEHFGQMYHMVGSPAFYERTIQDLVRKKNYTTARRAGLVNDPFTYEDFNAPDIEKRFGALTGMGNRGYTVLKTLRQDLFDTHWDNLPESVQTPEMATAIADAVNHITGVTKKQGHKALNLAFFAPRLEASRVAFLGVDPARAAMTFLKWKNATPEAKWFAVHQLKEKATIAATMAGLLAVNQGFLSAMGSKQTINFNDPTKGDFLKFKAAGQTVTYGSPLITMARFPIRLAMISAHEGKSGKLNKVTSTYGTQGEAVGEYLRSQFSPFASLATDLETRSDFRGRPLPNSAKPVPKRLAEQGIVPYTWKEFAADATLPIPAQEAVNDVWQKDKSIFDSKADTFLKIIMMAGTGARINDDWQVKK